jgi:hypothetical protein
MDNDRGRSAKPQAHQKHPDPWQPDLNPDHLAGQNIGPPADELASPHATGTTRLLRLIPSTVTDLLAILTVAPN